MSLTVTHAKVSAIADDPAASAAGEVLPSDWNAAHTVAFTGPVALPYAAASMEWEATDGKGFGFGFSEDSAPLDNHIWNHGFNLGTISDPSEPKLFVSMESNYEADGANFMEYHLNYVPAGGSGALRPFSADIERSTDNIRFRICAEPLWFGVPNGSKNPVTWSFTGADGNPLLLIDDEWSASGVSHYGIRYIVDATAGGTGTLLSLETSAPAILFRVNSDGKVQIGPEAPNQLLSISSSGVAGFNVKTTASGNAVMTFTASGSLNYLVAANSSNGRLQVKMSAGLSAMLDIENKALRIGYDNYNGSSTCSVWDGTATTGVTALSIREGAGQSTSDYLTVFTGGWSVKKASINPSAFYFYGSYTDSSNYVRAALSSSSSAATLAAETAGTGADNVPINITPAGTEGTQFTNFLQLTEMTAPSAGASNTARIFAEDNGSGKTRLMVQFASGAAQQIAIEP